MIKIWIRFTFVTNKPCVLPAIFHAHLLSIQLICGSNHSIDYISLKTTSCLSSEGRAPYLIGAGVFRNPLTRFNADLFSFVACRTVRHIFCCYQLVAGVSVEMSAVATGRKIGSSECAAALPRRDGFSTNGD